MQAGLGLIRKDGLAANGINIVFGRRPLALVVYRRGVSMAATAAVALSAGIGILFLFGAVTEHMRPASETHHQEEQSAEKQNL